MRSRRNSRRRVLTSASGLVLALVVQLGAASASTAFAGPPADGLPTASDKAVDDVPEEDRDRLLGSAWDTSGDVAISAVGYQDGFYISKAESSSGYEWSTLAVLGVPGVETDMWVGNYCRTQDGSKIAVVYGPRALSNDERMFNEGAYGAIVDVATGAVVSLGRGYTLAYFNPGCGSDDAVALTRYADGKTFVGVVDARTGKALSSTSVSGQLTSAVAGSADKVFAAANGSIVAITMSSGKQTEVVKTSGTAYQLTLAGSGALGYVDQSSGIATARTVDPLSKSPKAVTLASGPVQKLGLGRDSSGQVYVQGTPTSVASKLPANFASFPGAGVGSKISSRGAISVEQSALPVVEELGAVESYSGDEGALLPVTIPAISRASGERFTLKTEIGGFEFAPDPGVAGGRGKSVSTKIFLDGSPSDPGEAERACAVSRNDPHSQALQPKPRQVEWAVDRAVTGELTVSRPTNWNNLGMAAYTPQGMFPKGTLVGGGRIPAQVMLGVLAQESNLWQATRYAMPGETGNPLIGLYYGTDRYASIDEAPFWDINFYADADCGYGIGQITDGMRLAGMVKPGMPASLPVAQQRAIALDYAANIARAVQLLQEKWNVTRSAGLTINNGDSTKIENWFFAVWAYNTGFYPDAGDGSPWGVGWSNNPGNPIYSPFRLSFLDGHPEDAAHPQEWPYQEKVMGFAANSLTLTEKQTVSETVLVAGFRTAWWNGDAVTGPQNRSAVKPPLYTFCSALNECLPVFGCTRADYKCWWHGNATWKSNCSLTCGNELYRFSPSSSYVLEQADGESFPPNCSTSGLPPGSLVVDDLPLVIGTTVVPQAPVRTGCTPVASSGTFKFDFGDPASGSGSYTAKIDTQQLGGGFNAHFYFSHTRTSSDPDFGSDITGTWTLNQPLHQWTRVLVHMPDHGAWSQQAPYTINTGTSSQTRTLLQRNYANTWLSLGVFEMNGTPSVSLSNINHDTIGAGTADIAWDAIAFQPLAAKPADFIVSLGDSFSSGEGASTPDGANYFKNSNNNGTTIYTNACHRSTQSWSRKAYVSTAPSVTIGSRADSLASSLDYHFLACSGAIISNVIPRYSSVGTPPRSDGELGHGQFGELSQMDQGYLDANTTLVTFSIGGNDVGFVPVITNCLYASVSWVIRCSIQEEDVNDRIDNVLVPSLTTLLEEVHDRAPNATIMLMGYPKLFETGSLCVGVEDVEREWLNRLSDRLNAAMGDAAAAAATELDAEIVYTDPTATFSGKNLCATPSAINGLMWQYTAGEAGGGPQPGSQSIHPNVLGTDLFSQVMTNGLLGVY